MANKKKEKKEEKTAGSNTKKIVRVVIFEVKPLKDDFPHRKSIGKKIASHYGLKPNEVEVLELSAKGEDNFWTGATITALQALQKGYTGVKLILFKRK